ncbi:MAG: ECF transporter S component [Clostridiaceae bacterium]|nr:ECF transporter S component [Eubacteriales bacterium]
MKSENVKKLTKYGMLVAFILILGLTPVGYIKLSPAASITLVHIPVIVGVYFLGLEGGVILGLFFGLTSLISCFLNPDGIAAIVLGTNTGFGLYNIVLIVCVLFLPRVLVGVFSALTYRALSKLKRANVLAMAAAGVVGSLTNTVFLLGALYLLAFEQTAAVFGVAGSALLTTFLSIISVNGLLEAAAAAIVCPAVGKALQVTALLAK